MSIEQKIKQWLVRKGKSLAVAESCSGGLLAHRITNVPGSSDFFKLGLITYCNEAKIKFLKISPKILRSQGAVSTPVAKKMAESVRRIARTDYGIGITGIAGPAGGSDAKPVGLTFIAVSTPSSTTVKEFNFKGNRLSIKTQASTQALKMLMASWR